MAVKSPMFFRKTVERTTFSRPLPAAFRIADRFLSHALGLRRHVSADDLLVRGIDGHLPGDEDESVRPDGLGIRPDRLRAFFGRNHVAHEASRISGQTGGQWSELMQIDGDGVNYAEGDLMIKPVVSFSSSVADD